METLKEPPFLGANGIDFTAVVASLGGVVRINIDHPDALMTGFVIDKTLQLAECPVVGHPVQNLPFSLAFNSYSIPNFTEVFHNNAVPVIKCFNYFLTNPVVEVSHKPSLSATHFFEFPLGRTSAFDLKFPSQPVELSKFSFNSFEKLSLAGDCEVVDSNINTNSFTCATINVDVFGNNHIQEQLSFPVDKVCCSDSPAKVSFKVFRNLNRGFKPSSNGGETNHLWLKRKGTSIVTDRKIITDLWLGRFLTSSFSRSDRFKHLISLVPATYHKLGGKLRELFTNLSISNMVKFDLGLGNRGIIANINNIFGRVGILPHSLKKNIIHRQFYLDCSTILHISLSELQSKYFVGEHWKSKQVKSKEVRRGNTMQSKIASNLRIFQFASFLPRMNSWVSFARFR